MENKHLKEITLKHKEYYARPSLLLLPANIFLSVAGNLSSNLSKEITFKAIAECEKLLQVFLH